MFVRKKDQAGDVHAPQAAIKRPESPPKQEVKDSGAPYPTTNLEVLETHINECLLKGKAREKIREDLLKNGWMEEVIGVYLK
jgi:hypothetical protein